MKRSTQLGAIGVILTLATGQAGGMTPQPRALDLDRDTPELWQNEALARLEALEYHAARHSGELMAPNRTQDLRTHFRRDHIEVVPRRRDETPPWRFRWQTVRWGRSELWSFIPDVQRSAPTPDGPRVSYRSPGLVEWYENRPDGLEQGFTIERRPEGTGALRIEGAIGRDLRAEHVGGAIDFYDANDVHALRYDALHVWDSTGRDLAAWFETGDGLVTILVDDTEASYPVTVDPVLTTPGWSTTGAASGDAYGWAVATAGDVNGDGFSDVLVSAMRYDDTFTDEGAVFLFLGSAAGLSSSAAWIGYGGQTSAQYGWDAGTAGDVNGDGFDDVIVGAVYYENELHRQGRAYVYHGGSGGLSASPAWTVEGETAEAVLGTAVGTAGDVNGDGFDDVIVGAADHVGVGVDAGRVYVYLGSAGGLSTTAAWIVDSDQPGARLGYRAATAGDVNGDGFDDVVVTAYLYDDDSPDGGAAWVYHGSPTGLEPDAAWMTTSDQENAQLGLGVGTAGDVNGDGYADLIVGVPYLDDVVSNQGYAYVYEGSAAGLSDEPIWSLFGAVVVDGLFGRSVGTAGDVNGDGYADVVIGGPGFGSQTHDGAAFVYLGSADGWMYDSHIQFNVPFSDFGRAVATAGDVDGDGFSDVVVGAWLAYQNAVDTGVAQLYRGESGGLSTTNGWLARGGQDLAAFGYSVAGAGDVNADGFSDVIVGAPFYDTAEDGAGAVFAFLGSPDGLDFDPAWIATGTMPFAFFGWSVAGAGDVNGDGYSDVIVGATRHDHGGGEDGAAFVYLGSASGLAQDPVWVAGAGIPTSYFGTSVSSAGDVNGDGFSDVIVGAPYYADGEAIEGAAFVYLGSPTGVESTPIWSVESDQQEARMGQSVATAGDVDGDGFADVAVGIVGFSNGQNVEGAAYVYHGSPDGPSETPDWIGEENVTDAFFGTSVASAGDVNGDGYSDLIVGAPSYTAGQPFEGAAYLYLGSPTGLDATFAWLVESNEENAEFGTCVASAGDVNGDGYSDVAVGAPRQSGEYGHVYIYYGSQAGLPTVANWSVPGNQPFGLLGRSVASAGDVNGDGFSDVTMGQENYSGSEYMREGLTRLYFGNETKGRLLIPEQRRTDGSVPIALGGLSDSPTSLLCSAWGRSPAGRADVRLEVEVEESGTPFDGAGTVLTESVDTGLGGIGLEQLVSNLEPGSSYRWRLRVVSDSPFFPRSPWFSPSGNAPTELDFRTPRGTVAAGEPDPAASLPALSRARPNPFAVSTRLSFAADVPAHARVSIFDVTGRRVVLLADRHVEAGPHEIVWDARDAHGVSVAPGVYFAQLDLDGRSQTRALTVVR